MVIKATAQTRHILLVEDEPTLQRILGSVLGDAGHAITTAGTAEQALDVLDGGDVDLVLSDKNLPKMSGLDLLAQVRAAERAPKHPKRSVAFMMVTGYPSRDSALAALADDADGYLVKPFRSLAHAVEQIQRILDGDLALRRQGPPRARKVAHVLAGLPEDLGGQRVALVDAVARRSAAAVVAAGGDVVDVDDSAGLVIVAADRAHLCTLAARHSGAGLVLGDGGATFQDIVELIGAGGGAVVDLGGAP